jgi:hypothetical protein
MILLKMKEIECSGVTTGCSLSGTTAHRIMTEYLSLKPPKVQFVPQLYEDLQDR